MGGESGDVDALGDEDVDALGGEEVDGGEGVLGVLVRVVYRLSAITSYGCGSPLLLHAAGTI